MFFIYLQYSNSNLLQRIQNNLHKHMDFILLELEICTIQFAYHLSQKNSPFQTSSFYVISLQPPTPPALPPHIHKNISALFTISFSSISAVSLSFALTEIYSFSFGSVPEGRTTTEQLSSRRNFSTSDLGRPSIPET